ncbi:MAG: FAD-binding protein, partial [Thermoplasmata archaeon]|nr:FAD-binding protein [Thermoplasmata archaeon]
VVVKVVPDADSVGFDPDRKTLRRDSGALFLNPFDQRALRVALELRRTGEHVSVVSMGPPSAETALRETVALGADRATLITDPALAGSDTLVTARVLAKYLARAPADLVLAGQCSTDSETGQVPPQLAELLDRPVVTAVHRLIRSVHGREFEAVVDTDSGSARAIVFAPAVVSVGEKVGKPLHLSEEAAATVASRVVTRVSVAELGLSPFHVGLPGSPTSVERLVDHTPSRRKTVFAEGSAEERVTAALAVVRSVLAAPTAPASRLPLAPRSATALDGAAFAFVTQEAGALEPTAITALSELRRSLPRRKAIAIWVGPRPSDATLAELAVAGAEELVEFAADSGISSRTAAGALIHFVEQRPGISVGLFASTQFGREVAGRVAARLSLGLTGDVVAVREGPDAAIRFDKPAFGGGLIAEIACRTTPALATVRPGAFARGVAPNPPKLLPTAGLPLPSDSSIRWIDRTIDPSDGTADPASAPLLFCVGVGASSPGALAAVRAVAVPLGAGLVGTRRVVDAGGLSVSRQVGLTGHSV